MELSETQLEEVLIQLGLWPNDSPDGSINVHHFLKHCVKEHIAPSKEEYLERSIASKIPKVCVCVHACMQGVCVCVRACKVRVCA